MKKKTMEIILFIYSVIIRLLCSYNAPFYGEESINSDNAIFYMIGRALLQGKVLYKDIFDHKPPYIYFLNSICAIFSWHHIGLFVVDVIVTFIIMLFTYKISKLFTENKLTQLLSIIFTGFILNFDQISNGMCRTETISIALLLPCIYIFFKYFVSENKFEYKNMFLIGILSGITFMFSLKSPVILVPFAFVTLFIHIKNKKYKEVVLLFISGFLGVIISMLPAFIYIIYNGCINDAIKDLIDVNIIYAANDACIGSEKESILGAISNWKSHYAPFFVFLLYAFTIFLIAKYNIYIKITTILSFIIVFLYTFMVNRQNPYYLQMFTPYMTIFVLLLVKEIISITENMKISKTFPRYVFVLICFVFTLFLNICFGTKRIFTNVKYFKNYMVEMNKAISSEYENVDNLKILSIGSNCEPYIYTNAKYNFKYQLIPYIKYEKYKEPFDMQEKYILDAEPDIVVFKKDLFVLQFPMEKYNKFLANLIKNYRPFAKINTIDKEEPYVLFKKDSEYYKLKETSNK